MLLRKITQHVRDQNWFAVFIDFIIVVVGVFIGIQVANWNETQNNKKSLMISLERLNTEVHKNIAVIDEILASFQDTSNDMRIGREALNNCDYSPENQKALERLFFHLTNDVQPNFITQVIEKLNGQDQYMALLSLSFQEDFSNFAASLSEEYEQLTSHYENMWAQHVNFHPFVDAYFAGDPGKTGNQSDYEGWGFRLGTPFEEVCKNASFRNRFINTIGFYSSINRRITLLKAKVIKFQENLRKEIETQK